MRKIGFENIIGKGGDSVLIQVFSPFPTMLSIPTSLKQISPFGKELTYIIDSVKK